MGLIRNFINEQKDKRISSMSKDEMIEALKTEKLDEYTIDAIAKGLNVDIENIPKNQIYIPCNIVEDSLDKQHLVRMLAGELTTGDVIRDTDNHMEYHYKTKIFGSFISGFEGKFYHLNDTPNEELPEIKVTVPAKIMGEPVVSLSRGFKSTMGYKIDLDIQAKGVIFNDALLSSGIRNIPDFDTIKPIRTDGIRGIPERPSLKYMYNMLRWCDNIKPETRVDFIVKNYGNPGLNGSFATYMAGYEFGMDEKAYLTQEDVDKLNKMVKDVKEATIQQKLTYCAQLYHSARPKVTTDFGHKTKVNFEKEFREKFNIYDKESISDAYIATLDKEQMDISKTEVLQNGIMTPLYLITTDDNIVVAYNPEKNVTSKAGNIIDGNVELSDAYSKYEFKDIPQEEYDDILKPLREEYVQFRDDIANDVLIYDATSVPTTSFDEEEIGEK